MPPPKTYREIEDEVNRLARIIDAPPTLLPTYRHSEDAARPHIEVHGSEFYWVVVERGQVLDRQTYLSLDSLLSKVFQSVTFSMACDWELRHRRPGEDSRRQMFQHQVDLLEQLNPAWAEAEHERHKAILLEHPFVDDDVPSRSSPAMPLAKALARYLLVVAATVLMAMLFYVVHLPESAPLIILKMSLVLAPAMLTFGYELGPLGITMIATLFYLVELSPLVPFWRTGSRAWLYLQCVILTAHVFAVAWVRMYLVAW